MVWWVKGLINHPILKATTNVGLLLHTHTMEREVLMWNEIHTWEYATVLFRTAVMD